MLLGSSAHGCGAAVNGCSLGARRPRHYRRVTSGHGPELGRSLRLRLVGRCNSGQVLCELPLHCKHLLSEVEDLVDDLVWVLLTGQPAEGTLNALWALFVHASIASSTACWLFLSDSVYCSEGDDIGFTLSVRGGSCMVLLVVMSSCCRTVGRC